MFDPLVENERTNALMGWLSVVVVAAAGVAALVTGAVLWAGLATVTVGLAVLPAALTRNWRSMAPWPALLLPAVALAARGVALYPEVAGYLALAGLSLVGVAELDAFAPVEFSRWFAVLTTVLTTLALAAVWIVVQYYADAVLGTALLGSQTELQRDIVAVTVVAVAVGAAFQWLFSSQDSNDADRTERFAGSP